MFFLQEQPLTQPTLVQTIVAAIITSGVLSSLITLLGVWLQNRSNDKRQRSQIQADSQERRVEREMALKRTIYVEGAEALGKQQQYVLMFGNPLIDDSEQGKIVEGLMESLNKVALVASIETLRLLDTVQAHYGESVRRLAIQRSNLRVTMDALRADEASHQNTGQSLIQLTAELNSAIQRKDTQNQTLLIQQSHTVQQQYQAEEHDLRARRQQLIPAIGELIRGAADAAIRFDDFAQQLNCSVRDELGFPISREEYEALLREAGERQRAQLAAWTADWQQQYTNWAENSPFG